MIYGYVEQPSPRAGEPLTVRVSTDAPQFRVELYRFGTGMQHCSTSEWLPGTWAAAQQPGADGGQPGRDLTGRELPGWPMVQLPLPTDSRPGVYIAVFVEGNGKGTER